MTRYAALLRAVNLGSHGKVAMGELRQLVESLGHREVQTYLQSGNVVFDAGSDDEDALAAAIEEALARRLKLTTRVLVRGPADLAGLVAANPFPEMAHTEPAKLHVAFLSAAPAEARLAAIDRDRIAPDEIRPGDRAVYLRYPNGAGRSKLTTDLIERALGVTATARNWNTVRKLVELTGA